MGNEAAKEDDEGSTHALLQGLRQLRVVEGTPSFGLMFSEETGGPRFTPLQLVRAFSNKFTVTCMQVLRLLRQLPPIVLGRANLRAAPASWNSDRGTVVVSDENSAESSEPIEERDEPDADVAARPVVVETPDWVVRFGLDSIREWQVCVLSCCASSLVQDCS